MTDFFSRIGLVLEALVTNSTINGDRRHEALRLCQELQSAPDDITSAINERVAAAAERLDGRLAYFEEDVAKTRAVTFSRAMRTAVMERADDDEREVLAQAFDGDTYIAALDHDLNGETGGRAPAPATENVEEMTTAQLKAFLDEKSAPYRASAPKSELQALARAIVAVTPPPESEPAPEAPVGEPVPEVVDAPQS